MLGGMVVYVMWLVVRWVVGYVRLVFAFLLTIQLQTDSGIHLSGRIQIVKNQMINYPVGYK